MPNGRTRRRPASRTPIALALATAAVCALTAAPSAMATEAPCPGNAKAGFARTQLFNGANCSGGSVITTAHTEVPDFRGFVNYDGKTYDVDNSRSSLAVTAGTCVRLYDSAGYGGDASTPICATSRTLYWNLSRLNDRASSMRICTVASLAACGPGASTPPATTPPPPAGAAAPARRAVDWAVSHVSWWAGKYSMTYRLPTNKSIAYMQQTAPPRGGNQGCDCSSFLKWAMAQANVDIGNTTYYQWSALGKMPANYTSSSASTVYGPVLRGQGTTPPGGFKIGDLIFYGVTGLGTGTGHVALYMGDGKIVQCSGSRGSNAGLSMDYVRRTGWVRYTSVTG